MAVLVAISIPIFSAQLEKARQATDLANIRAAYAEAMVDALDSDDGEGTATSVPMKTVDEDWGKVGSDARIGETVVNTTNIPVENGKTVVVTVDSTGTVSFAVGS